MARAAVGLTASIDPIDNMRTRNPSYGDILQLARNSVADSDSRLDPADPNFDFELVLGRAKKLRQQRLEAAGLNSQERQGGIVWKDLTVQGMDLGGREIDTVVNVGTLVASASKASPCPKDALHIETRPVRDREANPSGAR
jgi:hypothetical protein